MSFHIEGIVRRGAADHEGNSTLPGQKFDSLGKALGAIGAWIDRGEFLDVVCFYVYDSEGGLAWTLVPHFPNLT